MNDVAPINFWGSFVFSYRRLHDITQEQLADKLSVSQQTVSRWEAGQQIPDARSQAVLRAVLGEADLASQKIWIERVRRASGNEILLDRNMTFLSVSPSICAFLDMPPERIIGKPSSRFLPAVRPKYVDKAVDDGFFEGAFAALRYVAEVNYGPTAVHVHTEVWPVASSDSGILMHVVLRATGQPVSAGSEGLRVHEFVADRNDFVGVAV